MRIAVVLSLFVFIGEVFAQVPSIPQIPGLGQSSNSWGVGAKSFEPSQKPVDTNVLRRAEEGVRISQEASPGNDFRASSSQFYDIDNNADFGRFGTPYDWCGPTGGCVTLDPEHTRWMPDAPAGRKSFMPSLAPLAGQRDAMEGDVVKDLTNETMTSTLGMQKMVLTLTEPAIAESINASIIQAGQQAQLRYEANKAFFEIAKANPETSQITLNAYISCIQRRLDEGHPWIAAQSRCMGGDRVEKNASNGTGSGKFDAANPQRSFVLADDPNSPNSPEMGAMNPGLYEDDRSARINNRISAVDYLFNQLRFMDGGSLWGTDKVVAFKKDFRAMLGDVVFFFGNGASGALGSANLHNPSRGMLQVFVRAIPPFHDTTDNGDLPADFAPDSIVASYPTEKVFRDMVEQRYKDVHEVLKYRCHWHNDRDCSSGTCSAMTTNNPHEGVPELPEDMTDVSSSRDFWLDSGGAHQVLLRLSMPGMKIKPYVLQALFELYKLERGVKWSEDQPVDCDNLDASDPSKTSSLEYIMGSLGGGSDALVTRKIVARSTPRVRVAFALAQRVAFGQYMGSLARAEDLIKQLSAGGYDSMVRKHMLDMVYAAAGTEDIRSAMQRNVEETKKVLYEFGNFWKEQENVSGKRASRDAGGE